MADCNLIIRGGLVVDGGGGAAFEGDVAIRDGLIVDVGTVNGLAKEEIDAKGLIVTPGFVDLHTHYDGQLTWSNELSPSSNHGVTTIVAGNCGVGFAPCKDHDRDALIDLMSGVEDIPEVVMSEGLPWTWRSYPEFAALLGSKSFDMDVASLLPHSALRVFVMGDRALAREPATTADVQQMASLTHEAMESGAIGFATSRMLQHKSAHGNSIPTARAAEQELLGIAMAMADAGLGVFQIASDFGLYTDVDGEFSMFRRIVAQSGRPMFFSLNQKHHRPDDWKRLLKLAADANRDGLQIRAQVMGRPTGLLLGHELTKNPFSALSGYGRLKDLSFTDRIDGLKDPDLRQTLIAELEGLPEPDRPDYGQLFMLSDTPDYEQARSASVLEKAKAQGVSPAAYTYDLLMENQGRTILLEAVQNYAEGNLEAPFAMMRDANTVLGLGDGGAHMGLICDASWPTTMLAFWTRDRVRGERLPLPWAVKAMTWDNARAYGLNDRGRIARGLKADLNVIDYRRLNLKRPEVRYDLPAGGRRIVQKAEGYVATVVSGVVTRRNGEATGALPGRFVKGPQRSASAKAAAA